MQSSPDHYNWTQRNWGGSLSGAARQKVIKSAPRYSPLTSDWVMTAVWMLDAMNIHLYDPKIASWLWNDTSHMPIWYLGDSVGKMQCQSSDFDMSVTCFSSFIFSFLLLPLILNQTLPMEEALNNRVKEHTRKFVKEINTMLLRHFPKAPMASLYAAPTTKPLVQIVSLLWRNPISVQR